LKEKNSKKILILTVGGAGGISIALSSLNDPEFNKDIWVTILIL
jgi:hypothetical protein